jgi:trimethylamine--corrinoid protein Co-methyltransferase
MSIRKRHRRSVGGQSAKPPFELLQNSRPPVVVLSEEEEGKIHVASMSILENTGLDIWDDEARQIFLQAGAAVDEPARQVRFDRGLIMEAIQSAPSSYTLAARDPAKNVRFGGNRIAFGAVGGPPYVADLDRGRRSAVLADLEDLNRLVHMLDVLTTGGGQLLEPLDLPPATRHLDAAFADITLTDKASRGMATGRAITKDVISMHALAHAGPGAALETALDLAREQTVVSAVISVNSPLRYDGPMLGGLITLARWGQLAVITPFIMAGALSPAAMPAAIAQQNAEALVGVALSQLVNPGAPIMYGGFVIPLDLQSGAIAFGSPEAAWALYAGAQMARRYGIPFRSSGGLTTAHTPDAQAAYESLFGLWPAVMAHTHWITQAAGWLDGGLTASFEKLVVDAEMIAMLGQLCEPVAVNDETLALESIDQVGPGGHNLDTDHTMARFRTAFYRPTISSRDAYESWVEAGRIDTAQRANTTWKKLLKDYQKPPIDPGVDEALQDYMNRRKRELAGVEP